MIPKVFLLLVILTTLQDVSCSCKFALGEKIVMGYQCKVPVAKLVFQTDGNFIIYDNRGKATWSAKSFENAVLQEDGNFVIYDVDGNAIFASGTAGKGQTMEFRDNGNLVILDAEGNSVWNSWSLSNF